MSDDDSQRPVASADTTGLADLYGALGSIDGLRDRVAAGGSVTFEELTGLRREIVRAVALLEVSHD